MAITTGSQLGGYEIIAQIGAGGMGEVYRARDTRLHREVAIKVLSTQFVNDPDRITRFHTEAKSVAALNHPNIAAIYGFEKSGDSEFLILELVDGSTLAERIAAGPLPVKEALEVAKQIAQALEAAHEKGIVHRDLKPANIKVTPAGVVKVLDFGLAKMRDPAAASEPVPDLSNSPTLAQHTGPGIILGTAAYMSPEQARGKMVDKRTDVWAFGCILFEMLTGRQVFRGETVSDMIARILEREPDWNTLPKETPLTVRRLLRRCLEKDPANRIHDIADARLDIVDAVAVPETVTTVGGVRTFGKERLAWLALVLIMAIAGASLVFRSHPNASLVQFSVLEPGNTHVMDLALSPDGRQLAISIFDPQENAIWIRDLDSLENRPLSEANGGNSPFWSPDGTSVGFFSSDGKLKKVGVHGGSAVTVCDLPSDESIFWSGGTWNVAGDIVFEAGTELYRVSASGGKPTKLSLNDQPHELRRGKPVFLPDGRHFLYRVLGSKPMDAIYVGSLDGAESQFVTEAQSHGIYADPGYLLFVRGNSLLAQPFDTKSLRLTGESTPVGQGAAAGFLSIAPAFSTSTTATLAFETQKRGHSGELSWFDRTHNEVGKISEFEGSEYLNPALSPDARHLAANRLDLQTGNWDIWTIDLRSAIASRLTTNPAQDSDAVWSPDGKEIVFASNREGHFGLYRKSVTSPGNEGLLMVSDVDIVPTDWSSDGRFIIYDDSANSLTSDISALPLFGDRKPQVLLHGQNIAYYAGHVSPDGKWLAYSSAETGHFELYVQPFMAAGKKVRVSTDGGIHPRWRDDGRELYFWNLTDNGVYAVDIALKNDGLESGAPRLISPPNVRILEEVDGRTHYDITRDGKRLLLRTPAAPPGPPITVMLNWTKAFKK